MYIQSLSRVYENCSRIITAKFFLPLSLLDLCASTGIAGKIRFLGDGVLVGDMPGTRTGVLLAEDLLLNRILKFINYHKIFFSHKAILSSYTKACHFSHMHFLLSHKNPCLPCNIAITNFLVSHTCEI